MDKESTQLSFEEEKSQADNEPVICLGMTFKNDEERREYFREELRMKLLELKEIEGFPIGEDEDIIALSDPPYYTACPNPWINDFIEEWEKEKVEKYGRDLEEEYHREPFVGDVSEGKNHPIYLSHRYHTKVPHRAILQYILHYTEPGDIVLDGFSGSGMTGLASRLCNNKLELEEIGLDIRDKNKITNRDGKYVSNVGTRQTILSDLSPIATFITKNNTQYNKNYIRVLENDLIELIKELDDEYGWLLETNHKNNEKGKVNFTVWSEVFVCPSCLSEINYFESTVDIEKLKTNSKLKCNKCGLENEKKDLSRAYESYYDKKLGEVINKVKYVPVYINYSVGNQRFTKKVEKNDLELISKANNLLDDIKYPINKLPNGEESSRNVKYGFTHVHHMMPPRNLLFLSLLQKKLSKKNLNQIGRILLTASIPNLTWNYSWRMNGKGGFISGTLYIPSTPQENNPINQIKRKLSDLLRGFKSVLNEEIEGNSSIITTQSLTNIMNLKENSVDYIFTDPPFGSNLMYSELNSIWESWIRVKTNNSGEAIVNSVQKKELSDYQKLLEQCFKEYFRVLKPGHWMTVEFSNSQAKVWNAIQETIQKAGFVIANVSALDKKQGSFKAITTTTAVKQDLVISAYKPKQESIDKMEQQQNTEESAWIFVSQHLNQLPVFSGEKGEAQVIPERTPRILFDRMVAYHVQSGLPVPISSAEFQVGVTQRFIMRDGMAFLENQVAEYDKKRILVKEFTQQSLFVSDENSAIEWVRQQLMKKPQSRQDLHPNFTKELQHIAKHEILPELDDLLNQNFLRYDGEGPVPNQILTYLRRTYKDLRGLEPTDPKVIEKAIHRWYVPDPNKQADLEKLREKALLREYDGYILELEGNKKKLKTFRTEAIRAGFKKAYSDKDFESIVKVGERIPEKVIQEDDKLLMYYDNACIRLGL